MFFTLGIIYIKYTKLLHRITKLNLHIDKHTGNHSINNTYFSISYKPYHVLETKVLLSFLTSEIGQLLLSVWSSFGWFSLVFILDLTLLRFSGESFGHCDEPFSF